MIMSPKGRLFLLPYLAHDLSLVIKMGINIGLLVGGRSREQTSSPHLPAIQGAGIEKSGTQIPQGHHGLILTPFPLTNNAGTIPPHK